MKIHDLVFNYHGSIVLLSGLTAAGKAWIAENIGDDALTFCGKVAIEPRYVDDIERGAASDGLNIAIV